MTPDDDLVRRRQSEELTRGRQAEELTRKRQRGRATVMALLLGALVILVFAVSITRIRQGMPEGARAVTDTGPSEAGAQRRAPR